MLKIINNTFIRRYHSQKCLYGWRQNIAVGYGIPITNVIYQKIQDNKLNHVPITDITYQTIYKEKLNNKLESIKIISKIDPKSIGPPIIFKNTNLLKNGGVLFSEYINIKEVCQIFDNNILGPLTKEQV